MKHNLIETPVLKKQFTTEEEKYLFEKNQFFLKQISFFLDSQIENLFFC